MSLVRLTLPLRGLAGSGAQDAVDRALTGVAGIRVAQADASSFLLHIDYEDQEVSPDAIHDALARVGISHATHATSRSATQQDSTPDGPRHGEVSVSPPPSVRES